jgi:hypothetical protein
MTIDIYNAEDRNLVWEKGTIVSDYDSDMYRKDACGAWMIKKEYGNNESIYGWEIDHVFPKSLGGDYDLKNLRPMQHNNNSSKGNDYPSYKSVVTSDGNRNTYSDSQKVVNESLRKELTELYSKAR